MIIASVAIALLAFMAFEFLWVKYNGTLVPEPTTPRGERTAGVAGKPLLRYAVMGDSTAVSQGSDYDEGYAVRSAEYLAQTHRVSWVNTAVSGARARDVAGQQLAKAATFKPDIVLVAVGANDVTHLTRTDDVEKSLIKVVEGLRAANPEVKIVLTGSPAMGTVPRLPQPLRWLAGKRTDAVNRTVMRVAKEKHAVFAPVAEKTGPIFRAHPELFAADNFHPNARGYDVWVPVINDALHAALH